MDSLAERAMSALEPYVGRIIAQTSVRGTASSLGKALEQLSDDDLPAIEESVRWLLAPVAPTAAIDAVIDRILRGD